MWRIACATAVMSQNTHTALGSTQGVTPAFSRINL